jgi:hypothetical protein
LGAEGRVFLEQFQAGVGERALVGPN